MFLILLKISYYFHIQNIYSVAYIFFKLRIIVVFTTVKMIVGTDFLILRFSWLYDFLIPKINWLLLIITALHDNSFPLVCSVIISIISFYTREFNGSWEWCVEEKFLPKNVIRKIIAVYIQKRYLENGIWGTNFVDHVIKHEDTSIRLFMCKCNL